MILTLALTLFSEGLVVLGLAVWRQKPFKTLLAASVGINLFTQALLWLMLTLCPAPYLQVLFSAEAGIWLLEAVWLFSLPTPRLTWREALGFSLAMNLVSFGLGWFLPV